MREAFLRKAQSSRDVLISEGSEAIPLVEKDWRYLEGRSGRGTPFQSFTVAAALVKAHVRRGEVPRIVTVRCGGQPVLIFPTVVTTFLGLPIIRFLGDPLIQYGDALAAPEVTPEDFADAWSAAVDPRLACFALFRRVRDDANVARFLSSQATKTHDEESPLIDLRVHCQLSARDQREVRRLRRRLSEHGNVEALFVSGLSGQSLMNEALRLKREWIKSHGYGSAVIGDPDWEQAIADLCREDLTMAVLTVGGRVAAVEAAFSDSTGWYSFIGAFEPAFANMGPGQVLTEECIAHASARGLAWYDQLPPSQAYKRKRATSAIGVRDYTLSLTPMGRLAHLATKTVPDLKSLLGALPTDTRRTLLALVGY